MQQVNDIQNNYLVATQSKIDGLSSAVEGEGGLSQRTASLEYGLVNVTKNMVIKKCLNDYINEDDIYLLLKDHLSCKFCCAYRRLIWE